jgi:hypothetical protein
MLITALAIAGMAFSFLNDPLRVAFMAHERDEYYSGLIIIERLMATGAGFTLLLNGHGEQRRVWGRNRSGIAEGPPEDIRRQA